MSNPVLVGPRTECLLLLRVLVEHTAGTRLLLRLANGGRYRRLVQRSQSAVTKRSGGDV